MTDFELNKAIAVKVGLIIYAPDVLSEGVWVHLGNPASEQLKDYCNNWSDLMPLVVDYLSAEQVAKCFYRVNVQRALAECLLEVLTAT